MPSTIKEEKLLISLELLIIPHTGRKTSRILDAAGGCPASSSVALKKVNEWRSTIIHERRMEDARLLFIDQIDDVCYWKGRAISSSIRRIRYKDWPLSPRRRCDVVTFILLPCLRLPAPHTIAHIVLTRQPRDDNAKTRGLSPLLIFHECTNLRSDVDWQ